MEVNRGPCKSYTISVHKLQHGAQIRSRSYRLYSDELVNVFRFNTTKVVILVDLNH